jgi:hypothetical protein
MASTWKYIEDKMVVFDMEPIFQRKVRRYSEETIYNIVAQIVMNIEDLPKKDNYIQSVCSVIKKKEPFFYRIDYVNEDGDIPIFVDISQIHIEEYLDSIDQNKYFKQTDYE